MWNGFSCDPYGLFLWHRIIKHCLLFHILRCPHYAGRERYWGLMPLDILDDLKELIAHEAVCNDRPNLDFLLNMEAVPDAFLGMQNYQAETNTLINDNGVPVPQEEYHIVYDIHMPTYNWLINKEEVGRENMTIFYPSLINIITENREETETPSTDQEFEEISVATFENWDTKEPGKLLSLTNEGSENSSSLHPSPPNNGEVIIFITNLSFNTTEDSLRSFMSTALPEKDAFLVGIVKRSNGLSKGYGFARLPSVEVMYKILSLSGKELDGRKAIFKPGWKKKSFRGQKRGPKILSPKGES